MTIRNWLILILSLVVVMSVTIFTGITNSFFTDDEQSTEDTLGIRWGLFTLNDGFEATGAAWDDNWDENGATTWIQDSGRRNSGTYSAGSTSTNNGYLTSDEIEGSTTGDITVSFWIFIKSLEAGDCWIQTYNGTAYNNWYDATAIGSNNNWVQFSEVITDPQYLIAGFRLRFDTTGLTDSNDVVNIDDVVITTDTTPPANPTGLTATAGNEQISLDWNDNSESDVWGYNVYRSTLSGGPYTKINVMPVPNSNYADTGLYGGGTYYYVVRAVDYGNNESGNSNQNSATATNAAPAAPVSLNATAGDELIILDWNDNVETDLDGYNVYRSTTSDGTYSKINSPLVTTSNYTDTPLYGGGTYYYKVTAVDNVSAESAFSGIASALANDVAPLAPTSVNATGGNELITIEWTPGSEGDLWGYYIYRSDSTGEPYDQIDTVTAPTSDYTDTPLYGEVTRYYVVKAVDNGSNESPYSPEANATTTDIAPTAPTGLSAEASSEAIILDWNDNIETDNIRYNVYRSPIDNSSYSLHASLVTTSDYTDTGLYGGRTYYYKVTAVDDADPVALESAYSGEVNAVATDVAPSPPTNVNANNGDEEILLTWTESIEPDVVGYKVFRGTSSGNCTELMDTLGTTDNYTDTPLYGGGTYYYVITAFDEANPTAYESVNSSEVNAIAFDVAPAAPTGVNATGGDEEMSLDWNDNSESDFAGYNVYRSPTSGGTYSQINGTLVVTSNYTDTPLYGGGTFYYKITAVDNGANESGYSDPAASDTANDIAPQPPQNLSANAGDGLIELDWDDNIETDNITYNIYRSPVTSDNYSVIESLWASSNYTDVGLSGGVTYYYKVTVIDFGSNESGYSNEVYDTVVDNPPAQPQGLVATRGNQKVYLNWDDNSEGDLAGYNIYRSLTSGNYTTPLVSLWTSSDYTNTGLTAGVTYYYAVTAVDANSNESVTSNETSATPWAPWLWTQTTQGDFETGVSANVSANLSSGNVILSAGGDAGGANMTLFWDGGTAPAGWTIVSDVGGDFYQRFPRGEETYGGTGGAATHTHSANFASTSAGSGSVAIQSGTGAGATDTHTHTLASSTISTDSNLPVYRNLQVIKYTGGGGVPATIPAGAIAIFDTTLPAGWTRYSAQDNYFVRGEATAAGTGGSANHTHTVSITTNTPTGTGTPKTGGTTAYATSTHTHSQTAPTNAVSNQPPYITVILAKADSATAIPVGMIAMFDASPTGNWNVLSNNGGAFYQKFLLGSSSYGTTGGSSSHSHNNQNVTLTTVTGTASDGKNTQATFSSATHTHTVDVTSFSSPSVLPPYVNVVFAKALYYPSGTIASDVLDTAYTGSEWPELSWDTSLPPGTSITLEVRSSDTVFVADNTTLAWTSVGSTSPVTEGLPSGRYKQWRAILTPDGSKANTPTLQEVRVYYQGD